MKTNREIYNDKPLKEAIEKYEELLNEGYGVPFWEWLDSAYIDPSKGRFVRSLFFSNDEIEEKIWEMEALEVEGYLLEWKNSETNEWYGSEFCPVKGAEGNIWTYDWYESVREDWYNHDIQVGYFKELGEETWFNCSCDWGFRLGVAFDHRFTPHENPKEDNVWEGLTHGGCGPSDGEPWRVRKITIKGTLSEKAKEFLRRNPDIVFEYAKG